MRDKGFLISTAITISVLSAFILIKAYGGGVQPAFRIGLVDTPSSTGRLIAESSPALGIRVTIVAVADRASAEAELRGGALDAALVDSNLLEARTGVPNSLRIAVSGAVSGQLIHLVDVRALQKTDPNRGSKAAVALVAVLLLYGQLFGYGIWVASGVIEEKSSRVVEILLSAIRARQLLVGKISGIGLLGLMQLLFISVIGITLASLTGVLSVPAHAFGTLAVVLLWFVLGFTFYASLFAVAGALVSRMEELQNAIVPINLTILGSVFVSIGAVNGPNTTVAKVASLLPFSSMLAMPVRIAVGSATLLEALASIAILVGATSLVIPLAGRLYAGAVLRIGARVKLRDAWRSAS